MKDFAPTTLWTIAEEMIGYVSLWIGLAAVVVFVVLFLVALSRRHGFHGAAARTAVFGGLIVGIVTVLVAPLLTQAAFTNLHGAVDWIALLALGLAAFLGALVALYGVLGFARRA